MKPARILPHVLTLLAAAAVAQPEPEGGSALELLPPDARLLSCTVSRGVLYVSYVQQQRTVIAPAFHTPAIQRACAEVGQPLAAAPPARVAAPIVAPRIGGAAPPAAATARLTPAPPSFTAQSGGSFLAIDGRNDGDTAFHCTINYAWTADGEPGGSRGATAQATLPARQSQRVVFVSGPYRNLRFVGAPRWDCQPSG